MAKRVNMAEAALPGLAGPGAEPDHAHHRARLRERFDRAGDRALGHFTHEKNPVACAAALATIEVIEQEGLLEHARVLGAYTLERLQVMQEHHPLIGDVRGLGMMFGVDLVRDRATGEKATDEAERIMYLALSKGLSFKLTMGNILLLVPALTIQRQEMDRALGIIDACLTEVEASVGAA